MYRLSTRGNEDTMGDTKIESAGQVLARQLSLVGESVDNASLFSAFEEGSTESSEPPVESPPTTAAASAGETPTQAVGLGDSGPTAADAEKAESRNAKRHVWQDKVCFALGVFNLAFSFLWIGASPQTFYVAHTIKAVLLFGVRLAYYRKQNLHYYFFDFCYLVNALLLLHCWVPRLRRIKWLWEALFACAAGPLAWSIPALRNSLVLHDFDKMTSLFMHWSPVVVVWALRWFPIEGHPMSQPEAAQASVLEVVAPATLLYLVWCVAYYLKIFVVSEKKIRERGYDTLYLYTLRKGGLGKVINNYRPELRPLIYLAGHAASCTATFLVSFLFFNSFYAHTALILAVSFAATWNGACYYFDYFSFRYVPSLGLAHKLQPSKEE